MIHNSTQRQFHIDYALLTKQGERLYNEDSVLAMPSVIPATFAVADGLGGHGFGNIASAMVTATVKEMVTVSKELASLSSEEAIASLFRQAQSDICQKKQDGGYGDMMTTMVLLQIGEQISWGHVGDSRLYYFQNGELAAQTLDHSVPQILVYMGEITPQEIRHHPDRNRLLRAMGKEWERGDEFSIGESITPEAGQSFLLCSDGFWEYIVEEDMISCLRQSKDAGEWLQSMEKIVLDNGKGKNMDNYSAITIKLL